MLEYIDTRPLFIVRLENYKGGVKLKKGIKIKVTPNEKKKLLKMKNGEKNSFQECRTVKKSEVNYGSR